ncbi:SDR family NAD(P)-dependent oxidoreductase [Streptomyces sediminimaris]|uniref:SDR family NAD(P)-dependent oxidoreductase n=1 Tax=Streptomyces sediminimaris TaxID=3383721 RepID=UPI00399ACE99
MHSASTKTGRVALVTGGGEVITTVLESLLARGVQVALAGPDAEQARLMAPPGSPVLALPCAHDDPAVLAGAVDTVVERLGRLDHLVNLVAARPWQGSLMGLDPAALSDALHRDLVAPLACVQRACARWMAANDGSVVNVVATTARGGPQGAALAGLIELTEWLAAELEPRVQVATVVPSPLVGAGAYRAGAGEAVCDLLTRRTSRAQGPVFVLDEEPACPFEAA